MIDENILRWAPTMQGQPKVRSLGRFGPVIVETATFGSAHRFFANDAVGELPDTTEATFESESIKIPSAVKTWRLAHANAKIRQEAKVSRFASCNGATGALHAARLPNSSACEDESDARIVGGRLYAGIYDGHAGWATARTLKTSLVPFVAKELRTVKDESNEKANDAIASAFMKLDDAIVGGAKAAVERSDPFDPVAMAAVAPANSGSCALLSVFEPKSSILRVACVGDSRAVLGKHAGSRGSSDDDSFEMQPLSVDQNGENQEEVARIKAQHPGEDNLLDDGRLLGIMVTRAFGDHRWKWSEALVDKTYREFLGIPGRPGVVSPPYLTAEPAITSNVVSALDFAIMASDGLWEYISSENAVLCVAEWLKEKKQQHQHQQHPRRLYEDLGDLSRSNKIELDFENDLRTWKCQPENFVVEDMDNAAVHLLKNALGGKRRNLFIAATMMHEPMAKGIRDDITAQVIFFGDGSV
ncbi:hypothetical protein NLG97_g1121 [Lecanicillium saksenae]|uniref:Uncharacterized protein n=1 Tax=Lecanicillium saksenae TaxID=468837 RepID=A0ACC1R6K6_9HYPO|nr:hypothetical protein NLG97_g1121 [Lecanicillium saksenae]